MRHRLGLVLRGGPGTRGPRATGGLVVVLGALVAGLAQAVAPVGVPLYDGVVVQEPYRYLTPSAGQAGDPTSYSAAVPVGFGASPQITAATTENPPQAQLIALDGVFVVPAGVSTLDVAVRPVAPPSVLPDGPILGNVYRVSVTDPGGAAIGIASGRRPTLAMRAPADASGATIMRFSGGTWQALQTVQNPSLAIYTTELEALGDFAIVNAAGDAGGAPPWLAIAGIAVLGGALALFGVRAYLARRAPPPGPRRQGSARGGSGKPGSRDPRRRAARHR
jgi:hypothetical protein